jgi:hypothetical protein
VGTKSRYLVTLHLGITQQDLPELPPNLQQDLPRYQQVLALDPYKARKIPNHSLKGALANHRVLAINWNGVAYRLVYRVYEKPAPKRVVILSFAEHDPAYERAIARQSP